MKSRNRLIFSVNLAVFFLFLSVLSITSVQGGERPAFFGLGGHLSYYQTGDADGKMLGGLQARIRLSESLGFEASADYRKEKFEGGDEGGDVVVDGYPFQLSALYYILKGSAIGPHLIFGGSWYSTNITVAPVNVGGLQQKFNSDEFGYHGGFGLDIQAGDKVYIHGDARYHFLDVDFGGRTIDHDGLTIQVGLTYYF